MLQLCNSQAFRTMRNLKQNFNALLKARANFYIHLIRSARRIAGQIDVTPSGEWTIIPSCKQPFFRHWHYKKENAKQSESGLHFAARLTDLSLRAPNALKCKSIRKKNFSMSFQNLLQVCLYVSLLLLVSRNGLLFPLFTRSVTPSVLGIHPFYFAFC